MSAAAPLALRVDVDFAVGLRRAVPRMLDALEAAGMRASFFVVAGTNRPRRSLVRLARRGYARRLWRLGPTLVARRLLLRSLGSPAAFLSGAESRRVLRRIVEAGCELAVHGHDHAWWAERAWSATPAELEREIDRGFAAMTEAGPERGPCWGSPNWRTTETALHALADRGVAYLSDCWGAEPFVTLDAAGRPIRVPHLPITLPSLEGLILERGLAETEAVERLLAARRPGAGLEVACVHDYFEGLLRPTLFGRLLEALAARGVSATTLREAAATLDLDRLPRCGLTRAPLAGFVGEVSWQERARS